MKIFLLHVTYLMPVLEEIGVTLEMQCKGEEKIREGRNYRFFPAIISKIKKYVYEMQYITIVPVFIMLSL